MRAQGLIPFFALLALCHSQTIIEQVCSLNRSMTSIQPGAGVVIGGIFDIRAMGTNGSGCGRPLPDTMQIFEAARYAINVLNNYGGSGYITGVKFGMEAYDTCFSANNALGILENLYPQSSNPFCVSSNRVIAGIVGPLSSMTTLHAATLAGQLPVSMISPASTDPELSDKFRYPTFLRTVPSYTVFAKVVVELLQQLQWQNILVIYTDEVFGRSGYEQLLMAAYSRGLCVSQALALDTQRNKDSYKTALSTLGTVTSSIAVLIAPNSLTKIILQAVDEVQSLSNTQWILSDLDITNDVSSLKRALGAIVITPRSPAVAEFRTYFTGLLANPRSNAGNPWFEDWFEETYACSLMGTGSPCPTPTAFMQSPWAVSTMKAVFAYAETVRSICQPSGGLCTRLTTMNVTEFNKALFDLNFTMPSGFPTALVGQRIKFDANGNPDVSEFTVYNYNNRQGSSMFEEIGRFVSNTLTLDRQPTLYNSARSSILATNPTATCASLGCDNCLMPRSSVTFRYTSGDLVIASLVNAHETSRAPFTCGIGRTAQLAMLAAAEWAVSNYKANNPNKFRQVTLGSLVADVCPDTAVAQAFLTDLLSGNNQLMNPSGGIIPYNNIQAFVDATSSGQAQVISPVISEYKIPEVLTSVTSSDLYQGGETPFLSRTVPSDSVVFTAISNVLRSLGWNYVQVATHMSGEYRDMARAFTRTAAKYGICVMNTVDYFGDHAMDPYNRTVDRLISNRQTWIVVVFGGMMDVQGLLSVIGQRGISSQLQLIAGTDTWGTNPTYIQGVDASDTIVFDLELSSNAAFSSYLQNLPLAQVAAHPFLRELFEMTNRCAMDSTSQGTYSRICGGTDNFNSVYQGRASYIIRSINTIADKLHDVIVEICNNTNYATLCPEFRSASDVGTRLSSKLATVAKSDGFGTRDGKALTDIIFYVYKQGWQRFATFNTEGDYLTSVTTATLGNYQAKMSTCGGACMECQYLFTMQSSIYSMGDWLIAGAFGISNSGPANLQPYICGDIKTTNGPQFTTAMLYALQQVNSGTAPVIVRGVKIGGLILDHCENSGRANLMVSDIFAGFLGSMDVDERKILAWITDTNESANETVRILNPLGVATVSPSATSNSLMQYQTFFRTIQGDAATAKALLSIVKALKYMYVQVVYSPNSYGRNGLSSLMTASEAVGVCIINQIEFSNASNIVQQLFLSQTGVVILFTNEADTNSLLSAIANTNSTSLLILLPQPYPKVVRDFGSKIKNAIISLQLQMFDLSKYKSYINMSPVDNPFFAQYYAKINNCSIAGYSLYSSPCTLPLKNITSTSSYVEDNFVLSTIDAVYSVVDALHRTIIEYCGSDYTKPCGKFLSATDKRQRFIRNLNNVNFMDDGQRTFRFLEREGATIFDILQSDSSGMYNKVGSYSGQSLDLSDAALQKYSTVKSTCSAPCLGCIMKGLNFSYTPGDVYLAGVFDVHERSLSPFICGRIKTLHGFLLLEAFHYALDQVNSKQGQFANILPGTRLGGVGLDACESSVRGGYIVSNIHSGFVTLAKDGEIVYPSMIDAYIGSQGSTASMYLARILTDLEIPQISYAAGAEELSDQRVYPFFYRTVPTDLNQVEAMLKLMAKLNITYVQILYEDNSNGISAKEQFIEKAVNYSICVAEAVPYPDRGISSSEISNGIVAKLVEKPTANTIVTFLSSEYINSVLMSIAMSDKARNKFRFVGSDAWGNNQDAIQGVESQAEGSVTIRLNADDIQDFENYINSRNLANSKENPWFEEYFQNIVNCYISQTDRQGYPVPCPSTQINLINLPRYQQDPDVVYVINAVYSAAFAIHKTLQDECGVNYTTVCQAYLGNSGRHSMIRDNLASVNFTDPIGRAFMFVNRSALARYRFNSIILGELGYSYQKFGSYDVTTGMMSVDATYKTSWNSDCNRPDSCAECPSIRDSGSRYMFYKPTQNLNRTIIAFFDIHKQGIDPYRCGDINVAGFQQMLTFFYALEMDNILIDKQYRILIMDTCSNSLRIDQDLYGLLAGTGLCNSKFDNANPVSIKNIAGVITIGERNTVAASRVLELPGITYLSPNALTTYLDDKQHLVRTVAPISAATRALASLLKKIGWTYIDVLYDDSVYGIDPFEAFAMSANSMTICRGSSVMVPAVSTSADIEDFLRNLNGAQGSGAAVLFGSQDFVKSVLAAANNMKIADRYVWVLSVDWDVTEDSLKQLLPAGVDLKFITVQRLIYFVGKLNAYLNSLTHYTVHNPNSGINVPMEWFDEYYQMIHNCTLSSAAKPINLDKMMCNSTMGSLTSMKQDAYTLNTIAAAYALINGLNSCGAACPLPFDTAANRMNILNVILGISWDIDVNALNLSNRDVPPILKFDRSNRWWDSEYDIKYLQVKKSADGTLNVQDKMLVRGDLTLTDQQISDIQKTVGVTSACKLDNCDCTFEETAKPQPLQLEPFSPSEPRNYYYYHSNGEQQYDWPIWAIVVAILTSAGLLVAVILFLILIFAYPTRGGTSALGYLVIVGIIGIYAINFAFFVHASDASCGARRFLMGVVYMIAIAPLLIKAVDNWRFARTSSEKVRYSGISSPFVLFLMALVVVLIQCIIPIMWLILVHPTASEWPPYDFARHDNWWCDPPEIYDTGLVQSFIFVMFIVLVTAIFSAMSFDSDRNNYECRWILFSCISTAGCFLVWMIVSTSAGPSYRDAAVSIGNFVNATLLLLATPLRKTVLLCKHLREKEENEDAMEVLNEGNGHINMYNESYDNPMIDLNIYDNHYNLNSKPSEY